jgi:hypothetical protein
MSSRNAPYGARRESGQGQARRFNDGDWMSARPLKAAVSCDKPVARDDPPRGAKTDAVRDEIANTKPEFKPVWYPSSRKS